ncbi:MAG: DUF192 domain-containing protein, partial [Casimicrobium sp.]
MKFRNLLSVSGFMLATMMFVSALPLTASAQVNKGLPVIELSIKNSKLKTEVVADNMTRSIGLMNRFSLAPDHGMLFVFAQSEPLAFWMKNTFVPLSIA